MTQLDRATLTWEIDNFANLDSSYKYSSDLKTKQGIFYLRCYPKDCLKHMTDQIVIYFLKCAPYTTDLKVLVTISLINDNGEECYPKDIETKFTAETGQYPIEGGLFHLARDTILNASSGLLTGGKLIIKSTVTILDDKIIANVGDSKKITFAHKKALENYQPHLDTSKYSDVVFVVGTKEFKLHKIVLASQSPVFSAMFENDLEEAKQNRVEITNVDVEVFEAMIRFIYTGNVDSVQQCELDLFVAADKYQLESLKDICADHLGSNLSIESVANILLVAYRHSEAQLKSKCIEFINNKNATKVFATDGWKQLVKSRHELVDELYYDVTNKFENN